VIRDLVGDGHEFMAVVMGQGRAERALRKLLADYGLSEIVTLVPPLDPWRSVLAAGDVLVQPRPNEAFSAILLEALGLGTAVVACAGGVDDLIVPNQTALVFERQDEQGLHDHLARLLSDHPFARRLAGMAQSYIGGRFSVGAMVAETLETYTEAQQGYGQMAH
jgi:glycosyltransferase involved in cell wall biosynthesis